MSSQVFSLPSGTVVEMAVLSTDIEGSTTLSEDVRAKLNKTLRSFAEQHLIGIATKAVVKVEGDSLLVITGDVAAVPRIASRLLGAFQAEANRLQRNDLRLRMGASFGRLELVSGVHGMPDANGDPIARAVRIQAENIEAKELWCDESVIQALIRSNTKTQITVLGKKNVRSFGELTLFTISEEVLQPALFKELTCFHQGHAIQNWCIASWLHRAFKELMASEKPSSSDNMSTELTERKKALQGFLRESLQQASLGTFAILQKYFASRLDVYAGHAPRICLKGFDDEKKVIDLVRENGVALCTPIWQSENSGFNHVVNTGTPFLCNDLITDLESYNNPRLIREKVLELKKRVENYGHHIDAQDWIACWSDGHKNPQNSYRSTLIVPLTLKNNTGMLAEFKNVFGWGIDAERMIYGTICFDHVAPHFFRQEDIELAYVAADWLSLYLISQINFTTGSRTFTKSSVVSQAL